VRNFKAYFSALNDELKSELDVLDELDGVKRDLKEVKKDFNKPL